jgi:hypothetical protein
MDKLEGGIGRHGASRYILCSVLKVMVCHLLTVLVCSMHTTDFLFISVEVDAYEIYQ